MRSLSFADQVQALSVAVSRQAVLAAQQRRERDDFVRRAQEGRRKSGRVFNYDRICAAMKPHRGYRWEELEAASGLPRNTFKSALTTAVSNGRIDKIPERDGNHRYSLPC